MQVTTERNQARLWVPLESSLSPIPGGALECEVSWTVSHREARGRPLAVAHPWGVRGKAGPPAVQQPTLLEPGGGSRGGFQGEGGRNHRSGFLGVKEIEVQ